MYAVIKSGGKQHRVVEGEYLKVELIKSEKGSQITFDEVLMIGGDNAQVGAPFVSGARVVAEVLEHGRGEKVRIIKHRRRKHYHKEQGHRQWYTLLKIVSISA